MQAMINGWIIGDGELAMPVAGAVLSGLGLRLTSDVWSPRWDAVVVEGTVTRARFSRLAALVETVIESHGFRVLTQEAATGTDRLPEVGGHARCEGYLTSVHPYEFVDFALPDVSQDWRVISVRDRGRSDDLVVEVEPAE